MPRVRLAVPERQREIETDMMLHCTAGARYATVEQVGNYIGVKNRRIIAEFLDGLPYWQRGGKKKWRVDDIAAKILEETN